MLTTLKSLWAIKWLRYLAMGILALLVIFLFVRHTTAAKAEYWHGQFDAQVKVSEGLGYTIDSLDKEVSKLKVDSSKKIGELQGQIDSLTTVASTQDGVIVGKDGKITALEAKIATAKTEHDELMASRPLIVEQKAEIALLKTQLEGSRNIILTWEQKYAVRDKAFLDLTVDYDKAMKGWGAEKDARITCGKALASLQLATGGMKLERTIERLLIVGGGAYALLKK